MILRVQYAPLNECPPKKEALQKEFHLPAIDWFLGGEWGAAASPDSIDKDCSILSRGSYQKPLLAIGRGPHPKKMEQANNILYMMCTCN